MFLACSPLFIYNSYTFIYNFGLIMGASVERTTFAPLFIYIFSVFMGDSGLIRG